MLTEGQLREFGSKGYLVLPGVVAEQLLPAADAEIDALVAESPPPADAGFSLLCLAPRAGRRLADAALRDSPAFRLAESLVLPRTLNHDLHWFQVALNIPPHPRRPGAPHLDRAPPWGSQARLVHHARWDLPGRRVRA